MGPCSWGPGWDLLTHSLARQRASLYIQQARLHFLMLARVTAIHRRQSFPHILCGEISPIKLDLHLHLDIVFPLMLWESIDMNPQKANLCILMPLCWGQFRVPPLKSLSVHIMQVERYWVQDGQPRGKINYLNYRQIQIQISGCAPWNTDNQKVSL